jgi:chemotaxis protein MotB
MAVWIEREEDYEAQLNRGALWAVTYGDLMSYLVIFFLLLYSMASTKNLDIQMGMKSVEQQFGKESKIVSEVFSGHGIQQIARLEVRENKLRIVFNAPILFASGSADLREESIPYLNKLAQALAELPNPVQIEGHTDNRPVAGKKFPSNWELSSARAFAVLRAFEINGLPSSRLSAIGYGEFRPVKPNNTEEGRMANRRIEVNIMRMEE